MFDYNFIRTLLEKRNIDAKELAKHLGISPSVLSDWKSGRLKPPSIDKTEKIADFFDVSVDRLLGRNSLIENFPLDTSPQQEYHEHDKQLMSYFHELNEEGREKVIDYARILANSGEYKKEHSSGAEAGH